MTSPARGAAQWVEEPGTGWVSATAYHQDTRDRFDSRGDSRPLFADGHAVTTSLYVTTAWGVLPGVDLWAQAPFHRLRFDDAAGERNRTGIGDPRLWLRVAPLRLFGLSLPFAIRGGVKLPAGDFPVDAEVIPLGEGQRDWELIAEVGHSFHPVPAYAMLWLGYRWRERDDDTNRDWGDERFFFAQVGASLGSVGLKVMAEGWDGLTPRLEGLLVPTARRDFLQVTPTVGYGLGAGQVEVGLRIPVHGRNVPAGSALVVAYYRPFFR